MRCLGRLQTLKLNFLFLLLFLIPSLSLGAEVFLKQRVKVKEGEVLLKNVAQIKGSPLEVEILSSIPVSSSPPPCRSSTLTKEEVARRVVSYLKENRVSFSEIKILGHSTVRILRTCTLVGGERIKELIENYLKEHYPNYVLISAPSPTLRLSVENFTDKIELSSIGNGYARFIYEVYSNGKILKRLWIPVRVSRKVEVVVASVSIPRGTVIRRDMLSLRELPIIKARGALSEVEQVVGKKSRRDILPGEVIRERDLMPNFIVKRGMPVKVVYNSGAIHIELLGVALQNGAAGDIIEVKNLSTGKILRCKVEKDGSALFLSE
ncbi:flagellar basal body P-ring formation chaperone FlgA [Thermovibrio sp.]